MKEKSGSVSKYFTKAGTRLWRYRFDGAPVDGKRNVISKQGFATRASAMSAMAAAITNYKESKAEPPPQEETVADWVRIWLRDYAPQRCQPKTLERYHQLANYVLTAVSGELAKLATTPLAEVNHVIVEAALYELLRLPAKRKDHLSAKTVREVAGVLSVSLNKAFRMAKIDVNPLLRVELPKVQRQEARSLPSEAVARVRNVCHGDWTFTFVELSLATGTRRGELLALEWQDIDWANATVTIDKSLEQTKQGLRVKRPKGDRSRKFRIGPTALAALRFQQEEQEENKRLFGAEYRDNRLVFCQPGGDFLQPDLVSQTIVRRIKKAGIKGASLHTLRHTHASNLLSKGVPLPAVSARLGHADSNITARVYSHAMPDDDSRAAEAWEDVLTASLKHSQKTSVTSCDASDDIGGENAGLSSSIEMGKSGSANGNRTRI